MTDPEPPLDDAVEIPGHTPQYDPYAPQVFLDEGTPTSGVGDDWEDPYRSMGGLARPDAYHGTLEFDCPTCPAKVNEKCRIFIERTGQWATRGMPCLARLRKAHEAHVL